MSDSGNPLLSAGVVFFRPWAENARDAALLDVEAHAPKDWLARALDAVYRVSRKKETFIVDDVWLELDEDDRPHEARAMGAVMVRAAKEGFIEATKQYAKSTQKHCHANPRRVWARREVRI